ncbi:peptidoglycan editing factor PgeF [Mesobacillus harenae]|uniref:peptidoglycan editing factor PgeF n=1 Tax=Mesobacillus harenae TaxID=2213203 RepID=UPI0015800813|nr:peptidoglycan editing factor PgeF [Mesobacillus harenae]
MEPFLLKKKEFFAISDWMEKFPGLTAGFSTRNGGASETPFYSLNLGHHVGDTPKAVFENRQRFSQKIGFALENWVGAEQTHGKRIQYVTKNDRGKGAAIYDSSIVDTDGFYTQDKDVLLTLCYADCVPLYFIAPESGMIGIAHAGWQGTVKGIGREMVNAFAEKGISPDSIKAVVGPSICQKCYIVDERVITLVQNILEDVEKKPYNLISEGQYSLDLQELNKQILITAGVKKEAVSVTEYCTSCHEDLFFSHRRDKGASGRMISFIGWKEDMNL